MCSGGTSGKQFLVKFRDWDKTGKETNVTNCCAIQRDGSVNWFKYPEQSETYLDEYNTRRPVKGVSVNYISQMVPELVRLIDICSSELNYHYS
jgi:hypothetical protein